MILLLLLLALITAAGTTVGWMLSTPSFKGTVAENFNGRQFVNPGGVKAQGIAAVWKWMRNRNRGPWQARTQLHDVPKPNRRVDAGPRITFINHSTFLIQVDGLNILTDPVWSNRVSPVSWAGPKRMSPPGIAFDELPPVHLVLLSHNHYDHMDVPTLHKLRAAHDPAILTTLGNKAFLERKGFRKVTELNWWDESILTEDLRVHCTPAQHFSGRGLFDRDRSLWGGFVLKSSGGRTLYYAGDSGYGDFFREIGHRLGPMDVSIIPIGAFRPRWFMSPIHIGPEEALRVHQDIRSALSIGCHFGTFPLADDGMDEPGTLLRKLMDESGMDPKEFVVPVPGKAIAIKQSGQSGQSE
jgi:L-ascorbate metabolism protein UlaG (beta-lactamase superfamily)